LQYAEKELQKSFELAERSKKSNPKKLSFPWRFVDDTHIKTETFIPEKFCFELDQPKILDLLTGHTLYNDSAVVLRELTQNAIDAVRLQAADENFDSVECGSVKIKWDSKKRELEIVDNGTGMTGDITKRHLLKVGSSRYQDEKFKEDHPDFSPISRFGIGVLSAFMVADTVEIVTCNMEEKEAPEISLRSVHGRYLIRLLDKYSDPEARDLFPHGTKFRLKFRASAAKIDILAAAQRWIIFPRCNVTVTVDDGAPIKIGFAASPKEALDYYLRNNLSDLVGKQKLRVEERQESGLTFAYGLKFDALFRDWSFITFPDRRYRAEIVDEEPFPGMCLEGIAVEFGPPGLTGIAAIANATGANAPKTNVARSSIENTPERREIVRKIYDMCVQQIENEVGRLVRDEDYSTSRAVNQIWFLAATFASSRRRPIDESQFAESFSKLGIFLFEDGENRKIVSLNDLKRAGNFWTAHSPLTTSVEHVIREMPGNITARSVFALTEGGSAHLPPGNFVAIETGSMSLKMITDTFEVDTIQGIESDRKLELRWALKDISQKWWSLRQILERMSLLNRTATSVIGSFFEDRRRVGRVSMVHYADVKIPTSTFAFSGLDEYAAVSAMGGIYFQSEDPVIKFVQEILRDDGFDALSRAFIYINSIRNLLSPRSVDESEIEGRLKQLLRELLARGLDAYVPDWDSFNSTALNSSFRLFDPAAWSRRSIEDDEELDIFDF
jgi:molecular chaperone HtpG